ncbi:hypothetical protein [Pseudarthrobacter sp. IC2-21]|uniref:hypothetical protein n=1 Tax=Pseudarthrobacter sp. IC2-21 TaxID=3092262 RepID=UPI002A6A692C|nr:hypothetical protein [Pseudarthrobacter sp. IC2-21]
MKLLPHAAIAGALAASLVGCTYSGPPAEAGSPPPASPSPSHPAPLAGPQWLEGRFQSQAAVTRGVATIRVTDTGAVLELKEFSTAPGVDLRIMLSPGTLSPGANGEAGLTSATLIDLAPLSDQPSQRIDMDIKMWSALPAPVRSVVIYNYADRTAHGTANLTPGHP